MIVTLYDGLIKAILVGILKGYSGGLLSVNLDIIAAGNSLLLKVNMPAHKHSVKYSSYVT